MARSEITIDLGALRHNVRRLLDALDGAQLWAVVKADAYGHGAVEVARVALDEGAGALCVVTVDEAVALRSELAEARILVMGPTPPDDVARVSEARLELAVSEPPFPERVPLQVVPSAAVTESGGTGVPLSMASSESSVTVTR